MIFSRVSVVFVLAVLSTLAEARSEESLVMRIFNPDYQTSDAEMNAVLKKADLPSHGYKKELITSLSSESDSDKPVYEKKYFYYKTVECSRAREVVQELQTLMPDAFSTDVVTKIYREINARNLTNMKHCRVGVEVHFKGGRGCTNNDSTTRRQKRSPCGICVICGRLGARN